MQDKVGLLIQLKFPEKLYVFSNLYTNAHIILYIIVKMQDKVGLLIYFTI